MFLCPSIRKNLQEPQSLEKADITSSAGPDADPEATLQACCSDDSDPSRVVQAVTVFSYLLSPELHLRSGSGEILS